MGHSRNFLALDEKHDRRKTNSNISIENAEKL